MASQADAQGVGPQDVGNFLKLLGALVADPSTTWIGQVIKENAAMKDAAEKQETESKGLVRILAKVSHDHDKQVELSKQAVSQSEEAKTKAGELATEVENAKKTIADRDQKLEENATTITTLQGNVEALDKQVKDRDETIKKHEAQHADDARNIKVLQGTLGTTRIELSAKSNQLKELQDLSCEMVDGSRDFVLEEINKTYNNAKSVAIKYFGEDLPEDIIANALLIEEIRKLVYPIPFPASNSVAAKKVRIAAFLAGLGYRLVDQIYQPYFIPEEDQAPQHGLDAINTMLSNLSHTDPKRELQLRSVLLAISPEEQTRIAYDRAEVIAEEIFDNLGILLSSDQQPDFARDIRALCRLAVDSWNTLRVLKEKIEPFTQTEEETEKYWLPAELDGGSQKKQGNGKPNGLGLKPSLHSLRSATKVILVWPGFSYGTEVLKQGFMLLDSQVKLAEEESGPLKRRQRAMQRAENSSPVQQARRSHMRKSKILPRPGE
ncbi:hypothetical protein NUW58_g3034 [Xylaria curta]|uniref:Uncharacterized protein n=1 Tax=Xylaria curta TaxID=42375 RepID=A0ACC1PCS5_9PEZI|nr:hypothetical protein NUW58_g3034 [Xylaria curta]